MRGEISVTHSLPNEKSQIARRLQSLARTTAYVFVGARKGKCQIVAARHAHAFLRKKGATKDEWGKGTN